MNESLNVVSAQEQWEAPQSDRGPFEIIDELDTNLFKSEQKGADWVTVKCANDLDNKPKQRAGRKASRFTLRAGQQGRNEPE